MRIFVGILMLSAFIVIVFGCMGLIEIVRNWFRSSRRPQTRRLQRR
jgi:hypothetical protein